jgi:hypothetical protein
MEEHASNVADKVILDIGMRLLLLIYFVLIFLYSFFLGGKKFATSKSTLLRALSLMQCYRVENGNQILGEGASLFLQFILSLLIMMKVFH